MSEPKQAVLPIEEPKPEQAGWIVPQPKTLAQKILEIQAAAGAVKKKGKFGTELGGSNYLRIEDAVTAVSKLMNDRGLILTGSLCTKPDATFYYERTPGTNKGYMTSLVMTWRLEDVESGDWREWNIPGEGYDGTDKGTPKAQTSSRKYAIIDIFNLAVGNDIEAQGVSFEEGKEKQRKVAANKVAEAASRGVPSAIDAMSQVEPEKKLLITRPEEYNGHYVIASGFIAAPPLDTFFSDTGCKRIDSRKTGKIGWKVPSEYEKGLIALCEKLQIEVEG